MGAPRNQSVDPFPGPVGHLKLKKSDQIQTGFQGTVRIRTISENSDLSRCSGGLGETETGRRFVEMFGVLITAAGDNETRAGDRFRFGAAADTGEKT